MQRRVHCQIASSGCFRRSGAECACGCARCKAADAYEASPQPVWLVKIYEVLPKAIYYLGDGEWTDQRGAKRFASKTAAHAAAREHDAVVVRLRKRRNP